MQVRWLVLGNWRFGWKTASKNSTASRGKILFREPLAGLDLATLTHSGSWIYPHLALLKRFCSLLGSHFQTWRTLWDRGGKALCTWQLQGKREHNISTGWSCWGCSKAQLGHTGIVQPEMCNGWRGSNTRARRPLPFQTIPENLWDPFQWTDILQKGKTTPPSLS